jgi:hypothetical protein
MLGVGLAGAALADAAERYYERSFVLAAHERCRLFQPGVTAALTAAALQARGAALRAGLGEPTVAATGGRARQRAARTACDEADLKRVKARVEDGFAGWMRTTRMAFPGDSAGWNADRFAITRPGWRLVQSGRSGAAVVKVGLAGAGASDGLTVAVAFPGRPRPYAARIVTRDRTLAPRPWPAGALPPTTQRRAFWSSGVRAAGAGLLAERTTGEAWAFSAEAAEALAGLDPRESFSVEFLFRDDSVAQAVFEVGDFAAGRAFLALGPI